MKSHFRQEGNCPILNLHIALRSLKFCLSRDMMIRLHRTMLYHETSCAAHSNRQVVFPGFDPDPVVDTLGTHPVLFDLVITAPACVDSLECVLCLMHPPLNLMRTLP